MGGRGATAYVDDVSIIVHDEEKLESTIRLYGVVSGAKVNLSMSLGLQLGIWRGKSMPSNSVVDQWREGPVKLKGVWLQTSR